MSEKHLNLLAVEYQQLRIPAGHSTMVHVSPDRPDRTYIPKPLCNGYVADVAGMPYLVTFREIRGIPVIPVAMGIAKDSYPFHLGRVPG